MKVLISVVGRFHAFDLAKELKKKSYLWKINTTLPKFKAREWGLTNEEIKSNIFWEVLRRYFNKYLSKSFVEKNTFTSQAKSNYKLLKDADVFIGWSGSSLEAIIKAKKMGKICILERGSSHYSYQMKILSVEYALFNKKFTPNKWMWERELQEYELADYISVPSTFVKKSFLQFGIPERKLIVNPYGVDLSRFTRTKKKDSKFRVISAGNFSIQKGSLYLLKAFAELNLENSEFWHLGSIDSDMEDVIIKYRNEKVQFLGHKPQDELYNYYSQGSVFCLLSIQDGFGMVLTQAMSCGLPIITSANTGGPDLILEQGQEGFVVNIRDTEQLKEYLMYLYNNPDVLEKMSFAAVNRVQSGFTWEDYGNRYYEFLKAITS
ncbi:glycosyltransferase [Chryseobacterium sp. Leaf394]|uniref:glycosyltransferase n=1 Tax=Chryseobacterium sp. Leaf394 TaxID=1736361 RepID=UPI0006F6A462|nr:glycosyltransferase [Chryseobacterium sp. Leaf394]KQS93228.1 hypothetical protein ASG21_12650 [Chryseobacterium sp. Leaf394]